MLQSQKTICIIRHDDNRLPVLKYLDQAGFLALSLSGGVILWSNCGMTMLIPAARIANMAGMVEATGKIDSKKSRSPQFMFTTDDAIILPKKIANALLGDER